VLHRRRVRDRLLALGVERLDEYAHAAVGDPRARRSFSPLLYQGV